MKNKSKINLQKNAVIFGAGPVGKCLAYALKNSGFDVTLIDKKIVKAKCSIFCKNKKIKCDFKILRFSPNLIRDLIKNNVLIFTAMRPENVNNFLKYISRFLGSNNLKLITCENEINFKPTKNVKISPILADIICYQKHSDIYTNTIRFLVKEKNLMKLLDKKYFVLIKDFDKKFYQRLYTHNTLHAVIAQLGYLKGYKYISEALKAAQIRSIALGALKEASYGLVHKYAIPQAEQKRYAKEEFEKLELKNFKDPIVRVARDPIRKLSGRERVVGPLLLSEKAGIFPENLCIVLASLLLYDYVQDSEAVKLQNEIKNKGTTFILRKYSRIKNNKIIKRIKFHYEQLKHGY